MNRYRHEYKYLIDARQEALLKLRAASVMKRDFHAKENGSYVIRSVYFDDAMNSCLSENLSGSDPRSKFRIRYYDRNTDLIHLEKKSKRKGMCLKESCELSREECENFLRGEIPRFADEDPEMKKRLFTEIRLRGLRPVTLVTYERIPFIYSGGNVRVTFDRNLTSSGEIGRFLEGHYATRPVWQPGQSLMEVKWDELLPRHLREALQTEDLLWTAFSKYYMCRVFHL